MVEKAPSGSSWAIGTEVNLVKRLAHTYPDKNVFCLDEMICPCSTMYRVHPAYLLWVLEGLIAGIAINEIKVDKSTQRDAKIALDRMLSL
jgi:quinolinate synthase